LTITETSLGEELTKSKITYQLFSQPDGTSKRVALSFSGQRYIQLEEMADPRTFQEVPLPS
jgi:hypothetical protein